MRLNWCEGKCLGVVSIQVDFEICLHSSIMYFAVILNMVPFQTLQNFMYTMLKDNNPVAAKMSLVSLTVD